MNIWVVGLAMCMNDNEECKTQFKVRQTEEKYTFINGVYYENSKSFFAKEIPCGMTYRKIYSSYIVEQGFEQKPSDEEIKQIELNMRDFLVAKLNEEKQRLINEYDNKIKCVCN